jgi:hypothetical protein
MGKRDVDHWRSMEEDMMMESARRLVAILYVCRLYESTGTKASSRSQTVSERVWDKLLLR